MQKGKDYIGVGGGCLILNDKNEVLLIRRAGEVRNEAGYWSKPGGGVKFGETAEEAMRGLFPITRFSPFFPNFACDLFRQPLK